jgi:phosphoglycerate dehydrogenase-like enzyme
VTVTVLVPDDDGVAALSAVDGVRPVRYAPDAGWPPAAADARVLVPRFLAPDDVSAMLAALPRLEYVQLLSAGAEHWVGRLPDHVMLSTCRGAHGGSTAELVVGALVALFREFPRFTRSSDRRQWDYHVTDTLQDKRVLIVGAGDIGDHLTRRLLPFDARVTLVGRTARDGVHGVAELPGLLGRFDVVIVVVPQTTETIGLVDAAFLARMADGAVLVNAARGRVVDTAALLAELNTGRLRAILDVTDPEPLPPDNPLWSVEGLMLFPHIGGSVSGGPARAWRVAAAEIARFVAGEPLRNQVHGEY